MAHGTGTSDRQTLTDEGNKAVEVTGAVGDKALGVRDRELTEALEANTKVLTEVRDLLMEFLC